MGETKRGGPGTTSRESLTAASKDLRYNNPAWIIRSFTGAAHNEAAWKKRVEPALEFLRGR